MTVLPAMMPCDVADPLLPAAALGIAFALSGLWARRARLRLAGWTTAGLVLLLVVAVAVLTARAPGGCPP